jgi:hypothetical protein
MTRSAPRSIDQYLGQLREELAGEDAAHSPQERRRYVLRRVPGRARLHLLVPDAVVSCHLGLSVSLAFIFAPLVELASRFSWFGMPNDLHSSPAWLDSLWAMPLLVLVGVLLLTVVMHLARGVGRLHAMYAKALLVAPTAPAGQ